MKNLKHKINANPKLKALVHWMLIPSDDFRPRWWVRNLLNPFVHKKGRGAKVRWNTRMDIMPFNTFYMGEKTLIESFATVNNAVGDVVIGDRTLIGIASVVIGPVVIGNDVLLAQNIVISGLNHGYEDITKSIRDHQTVTKKITIEDEVWIGANAVITAGVSIGRHSIVAAGSVVTKNVPPFSIVAGNPAKLVKQFDKETKTWERIRKQYIP